MGLPDPHDPAAPWLPAAFHPHTQTTVTFAQYGKRAIEDFDMWPEDAVFPFCYLRLKEEFACKPDRVPKVMVLIPQKEAQEFLKVLFTEAGCVNTKVAVNRSSYSMFTTPDPKFCSVISKLMEAVSTALSAEVPVPQLNETDPTSAPFPGADQLWIDVALNLSVGSYHPQ